MNGATPLLGAAGKNNNMTKHVVVGSSEGHPLWETQVALERGMMVEGARRVAEGVTRAVSRGQQSRLQPYQDLMQAWLPKIAGDITNWRNRSTRGVVPIALEPLKACDPYVAALIALRAILDQMSGRRQVVTALAQAIGRDIEHELMIRLWERQEPALFHAQRQRLEAQHADHSHIKRVNISAFNDLLASGKFGAGWDRWDAAKRLHVGIALINAVIRSTGWFETKTGLDPRNPEQHCLLFKPGMEQWVADRLGKLEECSPALKPTVIPPKRWKGLEDGGYWTPYVQGPSLIRFHAWQMDQRANAKAEYDALDMPRVYDALHFLQETPWRLNQGVYGVMQRVLAANLRVGKHMPDYRGRDLPPQPIDIDTNEEARTAWKREASEVRGYNALLASKRLSFDRIMLIAHEYKDFDRFYFPHMLDFRGRMYPIPVALQPQGNDVARSLLEFAEGKEVTDDNGGAGWLAINLAGAWGQDKISFDARIAWVEERAALWREIAADPLRSTSWMEADKPWQALAAILDWTGYLDIGSGYVSHAAVSVDGTCNGLQHLSAMSRDEGAGGYVNLTPGDKPRDIYQHVADTMLPTLQRLAKVRGQSPSARYARYFLGFADPDTGKLPRAMVKRPVMILPYSATRTAFFGYTMEWMDEADPRLPRAQRPKDYDKLRCQRANFLVGLMWDAVREAVPRAMDVMKWLKDCAAATAEGNQPIYWLTPDGFVVRHFYGVMRSYKIEVRLDGSQCSLRLEQPTKALDKQRALLGISPNFVHSLDACAARLCINRAAEDGAITAFAAIHDSYGTHAADMWRLYGYLRETFVETHEAGLLATFRNACMSVIVGHLIGAKGIDPLAAFQVADERLPPLPEVGSLDIRAVLTSDYFFA